MVYIQKIQREAEHSYKIYLECSGVLEFPKAKLTLLKWPDVAASAIDCLVQPKHNSYEQLWKDLEFVTLEPVKLILEAVLDQIEQLEGIKQQRSQPSKSDIIFNKCWYIDQINNGFRKLSKITNIEHPEIKYYDHSNS